MKITLAMMVKNEEDNLPRLLKSAKPLVDDIVIVDTGSTDKTIDIAKLHGARIYHHPWEDDFSKHRNQSISYVETEWMLLMDAFIAGIIRLSPIEYGLPDLTINLEILKEQLILN